MAEPPTSTPVSSPPEPVSATPPVVTSEDIAARLMRLAKMVPDRPNEPLLQNEWETLVVSLEKARFLQRNYQPTTAVGLRIGTELDEVERCAARLKNGLPLTVLPGLREEGYMAPNDGSVQPFVRYLPAAADGTNKMPLLVYLHGWSPDLNIVNWSQLSDGMMTFSEREGMAVAMPFGRSNTDFQGIGEQDVMRVVAEMVERYPIDEDRIILTGLSMGGMGARTIAAHYPDRFAGVLIVSGRGDYYYWRDIDRKGYAQYKQDIVALDYDAALLPNARSVPMFCVHGKQDPLIPVAEGRHTVEMMKAAGLEVTYVELPDADHWIYDMVLARQDVRAWIKARHRIVPTSFSYTSLHPRFDGSYWLRMSGAQISGRPVRVSATVRDGKVEISGARGARVFVYRKAMPEAIRTLPIKAVATKQDPAPAIQEVRDQAPDWRRPRLYPAFTLAGGAMRDVFLDRFVFVATGDRKHEAGRMRFMQRGVEWFRYAKALPKTVHEAEVKAEQLASFNVFVFGEPEQSKLIRQILGDGPVRVTADHYVVGEQTFPRKGNGLIVTRPWGKERRQVAVVQCGVAWGAGMSENHRYDLIPDYIVYSSKQDADGSNTALCAGFFDRAWRLDLARRYLAASAVE